MPTITTFFSQYLPETLQSEGDVPFAPLSAVRIVEMAELSCCDCVTVDELDQALRVLRRRLMVAIVWRDLNNLSDFSEVCQSMTAMAEACIQQAVDFTVNYLLSTVYLTRRLSRRCHKHFLY